jgi:hypothetical protein
MAAILKPKWSPKYKNPPIWAKFYQHLKLSHDITEILLMITILCNLTADNGIKQYLFSCDCLTSCYEKEDSINNA